MLISDYGSLRIFHEIKCLHSKSNSLLFPENLKNKYKKQYKSTESLPRWQFPQTTIVFLPSSSLPSSFSSFIPPYPSYTGEWISSDFLTIVMYYLLLCFLFFDETWNYVCFCRQAQRAHTGRCYHSKPWSWLGENWIIANLGGCFSHFRSLGTRVLST